MPSLMRPLTTRVELGRRASLWLVFSVLLTGVVLSSVSSKTAGAAGLVLCLIGLWSLSYRAPPDAGGVGAAARIWLLACIIGFGLDAIATALWHDEWGELHAASRLLVTAGATLALVRRFSPSTAARDALAHALTLACLAAGGLALWQGEVRDHYPSNAIPWAISIAFLVCLLLPRTVDLTRPVHCRLAWLLGVAAGVLAVLMSQSRGAYGLILWLAVFYAATLWQRRRVTRLGLGLVLAASALLIGMLTLVPQSFQVLTQRLEKAASEYQQTAGATQTGQGANSSVGARIYLWKLAIDSFAQSPLIGVGGAERHRRIKAEGERLQAPTISALGHVHNQYLEAAMDHGLIGVGAELAWLMGLLLAAWRVAQRDSTGGWQLSGLLFMHATGSLTNVNFEHNYYGAMLALCVSLALLLARDRAPGAAALPGA